MRLHHLAFRTDDLENLEHFYVAALGLPVVRRQERSVWLDAAGALVMLELRDADEPPNAPASKELVAFAVPSDARAPTIERLARAGITPEAATQFTIYVRDPDGRRIGLSSYPAPLV